MTEENGRPPDPDELPCELKTVNQIVAWNIAWYRKAAGLTQAQLGALTGREKRNISADETSWKGSHTREFSAQEIAGLATAFGIPIGAFFLPPEDDGITARYEFRPNDKAGPLDMGDLMAMVMPDSGEGTKPMLAYRNRMLTAVRQYMAPSWADDFERWQRAMTGEEIGAEQADDLRADRDFMLRLAAKYTRGLEQMEKREAGK